MVVDRLEVKPGVDSIQERLENSDIFRETQWSKLQLTEQFLTAPAFFYCSTYSWEFVMFPFKGKINRGTQTFFI